MHSAGPIIQVKKVIRSLLIWIGFGFFAGSATMAPPKIIKVKFDMESQTLHKGKKVSVKAEVYYRQNGSLLITRSTFPMEKITRTNGLGEFFEYDVKNNTVVQSMGREVSSRFSIFHAFFNGNTNDMGLTENGFALKKTRIEKKLVITEWEPLEKDGKKISKAELVHENHRPIFMAFYDANNRPVQKAFYSQYQALGAVMFPLTLTEFEYIGEKDSVITRRKYKNPVLNEGVDEKWFQFQVPASARVIQPQK